MSENVRRSLREWLAYFERNGARPPEVPWGAARDLSGGEARLIAKSVAAFQLGEYSEGRGLLRSAAALSGRFGGPALCEITRLFIREEQRHALLLKRFMLSHGMEPLKKQWTDTVFRKLRGLFGYELSVTVLITAEIISLVYYRALKDSTRSEVLGAICDRILADERAHVAYESEVLTHLRGLRGAPARHLAGFLHRFLFAGTVAVVWLGHRKVLAAGGYGPRRFRQSCRSEFARCFAREAAALRKLPPAAAGH